DLEVRNTRALLVLSALAAALVPLFWVLDWFILPEYVVLTAVMRGALTLCALGILVATLVRPTFVQRALQALACTMVILIAWSISIWCWLHAGYESEYYAGINLVVLGTGMLFFWRLTQAAAVYGAMWLFHMAPLL